jgi:hypothetical protein
VVSSSRRNTLIFQHSSAIVADPAFGANYFAYKLAGRTVGANVGVSLAVSPHASLSIGVRRDITSSDGGIEYKSTISNANFVYRF